MLNTYKLQILNSVFYLKSLTKACFIISSIFINILKNGFCGVEEEDEASAPQDGEFELEGTGSFAIQFSFIINFRTWRRPGKRKYFKRD
jgi:hypothetical protein